jgi:hypothetical protein
MEALRNDRQGAEWLRRQLLPFVGPTLVGGLSGLAGYQLYRNVQLVESTKNRPYRYGKLNDGDAYMAPAPLALPAPPPKVDPETPNDPMDTSADVHNSLSSRHSAMKRARARRRGNGKAKKAKRKLNFGARRRRARTTRKTRQPIGVYRVRKGIKPKTSKAAKYGMQMVTENGGYFSDPNCVYVGHSTESPQTMWRCAMFAVFRKLFAKAGFTFADWKSKEGLDLVTNEQKLKIKLWFSAGPDSVTQDARDFTVFDEANDTYNGEAQKWADDTQTNIMQNPNTELKRVELQEFRGDPTITYERNIAAMNFEDLSICHVTKSILRVQNRTQDDATATASLVNSVNANPLVGYRYECRGKGFRVNTQKNIAETTPTGETSTGEGWGANAVIGVILARAQFTNSEISKKPVLPSEFRAIKSVNKLTLVPGTIKEDKLVQIHKMKLNKFIDMIELFVRNPVTNKGLEFENYGKSAMIGVEKAMQTGEEAGLNVKIGWQLDRNYSCYVTEHKSMVAQRLVEFPAFAM